MSRSRNLSHKVPTLKNLSGKDRVAKVNIRYPGNVGFLQPLDQSPVLLLQLGRVRLLYPIRERRRRSQGCHRMSKLWALFSDTFGPTQLCQFMFFLKAPQKNSTFPTFEWTIKEIYCKVNLINKLI